MLLPAGHAPGGPDVDQRQLALDRPPSSAPARLAGPGRAFERGEVAASAPGLPIRAEGITRDIAAVDMSCVQEDAGEGPEDRERQSGDEDAARLAPGLRASVWWSVSRLVLSPCAAAERRRMP